LNTVKLGLEQLPISASKEQRIEWRATYGNHNFASDYCRLAPPGYGKIRMTKSQAMLDAEQNTARFFATLNSVRDFDKHEVEGVVTTLLNLNLRETCFVGIYMRAIANVEILLTLTRARDVQAISMLARATFELAVDIRLLSLIPNAVEKMLLYVDLEKLKAAEKTVAFKKANPTVDVDTVVFERYVETQSARIRADARSVWPGKSPRHWSEKTLEDRAKFLRAPFDEIFAVDYARVSWYVHPGLTGVLNVDSQFFVHLCASAFHIATTSYKELLLAIIREFKISRATENIEKLLRLADRFPLADTPEQIDELNRQVGRLRRNAYGGA
jgi:uncharacterized protein DUF5677